MQKHILLIEDISCVGRCALLAALPVLNCAGIRVTPLPTVLLSSHTGGFGEVYRRDLTQDMSDMLDHWAGIPLQFDAIHVGYLAGSHQLPAVERAVAAFKGPGTRLYVDPVMGDWGKRYSFCDEGLIAGFRALCAQADLALPNRTEAALLLNQPYSKGQDRPEALLTQMQGLLRLGTKAAVITGISGGDGHIGAVALQEGQAAPWVSLSPQVPGAWPGTGDLFAAALEAALLRSLSLENALGIATGFIHQCLKEADPAPRQSRFGAPFEQALPWLMQALDSQAQAIP